MKREIKGLALVFIIISALLTNGCKSKKKIDELAGFTPEKLYSSGMKKMQAQEYGEATKYFDRINQEYPYSPLASEAQLMESYAYYKNGKFEYAIAGLDDYINLYPGEKNTAYAYYLRALCYYDQIEGTQLDQTFTEDAKTALNEVINKFSESDYARDARLKLNLVLDHLAGKEMEVGRFYQKKGDLIAAINRYILIVEQYQTTTHIQEALYRLVECYHVLGVDFEARKYAAVLGSNYPSSKWYVYSHKLVSLQNNAPVSKAK